MRLDRSVLVEVTAFVLLEKVERESDIETKSDCAATASDKHLRQKNTRRSAARLAPPQKT